LESLVGSELTGLVTEVLSSCPGGDRRLLPGSVFCSRPHHLRAERRRISSWLRPFERRATRVQMAHTSARTALSSCGTAGSLGQQSSGRGEWLTRDSSLTREGTATRASAQRRRVTPNIKVVARTLLQARSQPKALSSSGRSRMAIART